jgi:hypothetical protein
MHMHMRRLVAVVVSAFAVLTLTACSSNNNPAAPYTPTAPPTPYRPPPATVAPLYVRLDAACAGVNVRSADVFVDGEIVDAVVAGSQYNGEVTVGSHLVEATAYYLNGVQANHWGPKSVWVPVAGFTEVFYCQ